MRKSERELNILCIGDLQIGKSHFLETYTHSSSSEQHYKIFPKLLATGTVVYLHEIQEKEGQQVYLKYPYDAILYFANALSFKNPAKNLLQNIMNISQFSGVNIYKIPINILLLSQPTTNGYDLISQKDKTRFIQAMDSVVSTSQIIYVQKIDKVNNYKTSLSKFYEEILNQQTKGIIDSYYTQWYIKGILQFFNFDQIKLLLKRMWDQIRRKQYIMKKFKRKMTYHTQK